MGSADWWWWGRTCRFLDWSCSRKEFPRGSKHLWLGRLKYNVSFKLQLKLNHIWTLETCDSIGNNNSLFTLIWFYFCAGNVNNERKNSHFYGTLAPRVAPNSNQSPLLSNALGLVRWVVLSKTMWLTLYQCVRISNTDFPDFTLDWKNEKNSFTRLFLA